MEERESLEEKIEKADASMCIVKVCYLDLLESENGGYEVYEQIGCDTCTGNNPECKSYAPKYMLKGEF